MKNAMMMIAMAATLPMAMVAEAKKPPTHSACPWSGAPTAADAGNGVSIDGYTYRLGKKKQMIALQGLLAQCKATSTLPQLMQWTAAKQAVGAQRRKMAGYAVKAGMKLANAASEEEQKVITKEMEEKAAEFAEAMAPLAENVLEKRAEFFAVLYATSSK